MARHKNNAEFVDRHQAVLRQLPLTEEDILRIGERVQLLTNRRERLKEGIEALEYVQANLEALSWEDAPARLENEQALVLALKQQLQEADQHRASSDSAAKNAEGRFNAALTAFQDADGKRLATAHTHAQAVERFDRVGIPDPTEEALAAAEKELARLDEEHRSHDAKHPELLTAKGRQEGNASETAHRLKEAEEKLSKERGEASIWSPGCNEPPVALRDGAHGAA